MCKVWDFARSKEEFSFSDHRSDVKSCDWHPFESLVVTGSKDSYVKVWDPRTGGKGVHTIPAHNNTITQVRWNPVNGNWFLTGSRDSKIKVYDIRKLDQEFNVFEGHDDPVNVVAWHPFKEDLFASATHSQKNGQIIYWHASSGVMLHKIDFAHEQMIWGMAWHPTGQMLATTSNDQKVRFWGIQKPYETVQPPISMLM
jgi:polyadenylation factor subunit 2